MLGTRKIGTGEYCCVTRSGSVLKRETVEFDFVRRVSPLSPFFPNSEIAAACTHSLLSKSVWWLKQKLKLELLRAKTEFWKFACRRGCSWALGTSVLCVLFNSYAANSHAATPAMLHFFQPFIQYSVWEKVMMTDRRDRKLFQAEPAAFWVVVFCSVMSEGGLSLFPPPNFESLHTECFASDFLFSYSSSFCWLSVDISGNKTIWSTMQAYFESTTTLERRSQTETTIANMITEHTAEVGSLILIIL